MLYAISRLEGIPFKWIQPFISRIGDEEMILLNDFDTFISKLEEQFGVSATAESCEAKLFELKQISSVLDYASHFRITVSNLNFNEEAKIAFFIVD